MKGGYFMAKTKRKIETKTENQTFDIYCRKCQKNKVNTSFYEATNPKIDTNNYMSICKDCINDIYNDYFNSTNDVEKSIYYTCADTDIRFSKEAVISAKNHIDSCITSGRNINKVFGIYKSKLSSNAKSNGMSEFGFSDSTESLEEVQDARIKNKIVLHNVDEYEEESIETLLLKRKWGNDLPTDTLIWLEEKYSEWDANYDINGKAVDLLVEQLCFEEFYVYQERQKGMDVSKRLKTIQTLMETSNLSPKNADIIENSEFQSMPEFIEKVERSKPFIQTNAEFADVDNFKSMWQSMVGALQRTAGKPDENTKVFEERFASSTMDLANLDGDNNEQ